ncbi:DUF2971 domain-containing protein [Methylobacterium sp. J-088]|uniref:DUF2971 domain-containing protein n=1 Tax=Methylobacterium sp. J-088 TaxID=2836664 RepID=UPI001FBAF49E|nr:DUF2971 domain-containing protein [Methylobacterium sp. J-088]MCJ2064393.1 DUF2971 domain-containing protein [Methylobacterium sp. J-088]
MKLLYKFVGSKKAVTALAQGSLKFTKIDELNDPSELIPYMNKHAVRSSLKLVRQNGYSPEQFQWLKHQEALLRLISPETRVLSCPKTIALANQTLALPIYDNFEYMERQLLATISFIRSRVGVLSLTERFDSLPMWAHYGVQASGYVVQFEGLDREFERDDTGSLNVLKPVIYVQDLIGMTHDPATQDNLFFTKFNDWSYEHEWRIVSALSACKASVDGTLFLRQMMSSAATGVICGWNVPEDDIRTLALDLLDINPLLKVFRAKLEQGRVRINDFVS